MAENENAGDAPAAAAGTNGNGARAQGQGQGQGQAPSLNILTQYIKDLSFEAPGAPNSLRAREKGPEISIGVNVNANPLGDNYDVNLTINGKAVLGDETLFVVELVYGGVFKLTGFERQHLLPVLFIECPRILFPFARQIVSDITQSGGFPPLRIDPIDFAQMFQRRMAEEAARQKVAQDQGQQGEG